jgi:hypothetical protein
LQDLQALEMVLNICSFYCNPLRQGTQRSPSLPELLHLDVLSRFAS